MPVEDPWRVRVWNPSKALPLVLTVTLPVLESSSPTNALGCAARQVAEIRAVGRQLGKAVAANTSWTPGPEDAPTTLAPGFRVPKEGESLDSWASSQKGLPTALPDIPLSKGRPRHGTRETREAIRLLLHRKGRRTRRLPSRKVILQVFRALVDAGFYGLQGTGHRRYVFKSAPRTFADWHRIVRAVRAVAPGAFVASVKGLS